MTAADKKKNLRRQLTAMRRQLAQLPVKIQKDAAIYDKLTRHIKQLSPDAVLTYISTRIEADTRRLIKYCFDNGIAVAVPRCENRDIRFYRIKSFSDTKKGSFGIFEPNDECEELIPTENMLCIVPALCFDKKGYRLGYGGGYYDRFLSKDHIKTVGICYKEYIFGCLPTEDGDICVDTVFTD